MATIYRMPESFRAGTTLSYTRTLPEYPANDGWTLKLLLSGRAPHSLDAAASGADHVVTIPATGAGLSTDDIVPDWYQWTELATKAGVGTFEVDSGRVTVLPNPAAAGDQRSWEEKALELLKTAHAAYLTSPSSPWVSSYQIGTRSVSFNRPKDMGDYIATLEGIVWRQRNPGRLGRTVAVQFGGNA